MRPAIWVHIDGGARPNPGKGSIGVVIRGGTWDYTISKSIPGNDVSNNRAEYEALLCALIELIKNRLTSHDITVYSDSEMLVEQMNGRKSIDTGGSYVRPCLKCKELLGLFTNLSLIHIDREDNDEANMLVIKGRLN